MGSNIDASLFVDNLTNKVWFKPNQSISRRYVTNEVGEPRMYGLRIRVNFD